MVNQIERSCPNSGQDQIEQLKTPWRFAGIEVAKATARRNAHGAGGMRNLRERQT
jgi:hypothetical protein